VRPACAPFELSTLERHRLRDLADIIAWPILTTAASLLPRRIGRLIRGGDDERVELDPFG
jgi:hypothetical protein